MARVVAVNPVDHPGGAETTLLRLLTGLAGHGWQVVLTTPTDGPLAVSARAAGFHWRPLPLGGIGRRQGARALTALPALRRYGASAEVIYLNGGVCGRLLLGAPPRPLRGAHKCGVAAEEASGEPRNGTLWVLHIHDMVQRAPRLWRRADLVLADSAAVAQRLVSLDPMLSPVVVHLPVDLDPPAAEPAWPQTPGGPVVGFVGRLEPRKGVHDLLAAVPLVQSQRPDVRFVLIGDDPYASDPAYTRGVLEDAARLDVRHVAWHDNAPGLMRHLDLLVLPSHQEPFGTVLAEAMAVGTPVVATRVDGLAEVVDDGVTGRLVPPGDPRALADGILDALARRAEFSPAAADRAQRWSTPRYVSTVENLLV